MQFEPQPTDKSPATDAAPVYRTAARHLHWTMAIILVLQIPVGIYMAYRAHMLNIFDAITNNLFSAHKLTGLVLLVLVLARLGYRLAKGVPPHERTLEPWQRTVSHATHLTLYALLVITPIVGWLGISLYPALNIFGLFDVPGIATPDQKASATVFLIHRSLALVLLAFILLHLAAALYHHFIRKDGVLQRMLVSAKRR